MTQQINLFNPEFRKKRSSPFSSTALGVMLGLVALAIAGLYGYGRMQNAELRKQMAATESTLKAEQARAQKISAEVAAQTKDPQLQAEIERLQQRLEGLNENLALLNTGALGDTAISGRTLNAEVVPNFLQRLGREKVISGRPFAALAIRQPKVEAGKDASKQPRHLEFVVSSSEVQSEKNPAQIAAGGLQ